MPDSAEGELRMTSWEETRTEPLTDGGRFVQVSIEEVFSGGIDGTSRWDDLLYYRADGTAAFVTLGEIRGELDGRKGSFVVATTGKFDGEQATSEWVIVPGSGTGELAGIAGAGRMTTRLGEPGKYRLDYTLSPVWEPAEKGAVRLWRVAGLVFDFLGEFSHAGFRADGTAAYRRAGTGRAPDPGGQHVRVPGRAPG